MATPRVVLVHRRSEYDELVARHGTRGQAAFFLTTRGQSLDDVEGRHRHTEQTLSDAARAIPGQWRRAQVERADLGQFVFRPEDIIVVVGQDGLVANLAKYVSGQPVIGVNSLLGTNAGILVPHQSRDLVRLLRTVVDGSATIVKRTMVNATSDDGQSIEALNEVFIGQPSHQSARYELHSGKRVERQSSSGIIVGTGTGATGWCRSIQQIQAPDRVMPRADEPGLPWFVREPWPSPSTGTTLLSGLIGRGDVLRVRVESDSLVVFGDGMEEDCLNVGWGQELQIRRSETVLNTVA